MQVFCKPPGNSNYGVMEIKLPEPWEIGIIRKRKSKIFLSSSIRFLPQHSTTPTLHYSIIRIAVLRELPLNFF